MTVDLYVVRHATAEDRDSDRWPGDAERPLTDEGSRRFRRAAMGLARVTGRPERLFSSDLVRARQTAELLAEAADWPEPETKKILEPGASAPSLVDFLRQVGGAERVAIVGHEPDLGALISYLLAGPPQRSFVPMKKGAVARVTCDGPPEAGTAILRWVLTPRVLQEMAPN